MVDKILNPSVSYLPFLLDLLFYFIFINWDTNSLVTKGTLSNLVNISNYIIYILYILIIVNIYFKSHCRQSVQEQMGVSLSSWVQDS